MIENFILVRYDKKELNIADKLCTQLSPRRFEIQRYLYAGCLKQIKKFYPKATIHVLTNKADSTPGVIYHVMETLPTNNLSKLQIFGLLEKPAMFIDCDVEICKLFEPHHLPTNIPFNVYKTYNDAKITFYKHYNTGVVWIPNPSKTIVQELITINQQHFSDPSMWLYNDEYPISYYIHNKRLQMKEYREVNCLIAQEDATDAQTIHYSFQKEQLLQKLRSKIKL
jgi:hypothetical protein